MARRAIEGGETAGAEALGAGRRRHVLPHVEGGKLQYFTTAGKYADIKRRAGVLLLADIKRASKPVAKNGSASLWDIGDGVACLEFHTKMNSLDPDVMAMVEKSIDTVQKQFKALVVYNEGSNFSVGANLGLVLFAANVGVWPMVEQGIEGGQRTYKKLKYAPFPVVGAPSGMALGGGCEILLALRGGAGARRIRISAWSRSASASFRAGAAARNC